MEGEFISLETAKLKAENKEQKRILDMIERYIRKYNTDDLDTKKLCILNDILLIKSGIIIEK